MTDGNANRAALAWMVMVLAQTAGAVAQSPAIEVSITVGNQHVIDASDVQSYSEGLPGIADIRLTQDGQQFIIVGQRPGLTSLLVLTREGGQRSYRITVAGEGPRPNGREITYGPGTVKPRANVRLDVYFVRFDRSYAHQLGIAWPAAVGGYSVHAGADLLHGTITDATVVAEQALPRLDMAEMAGYAKLLRHSALITANGSEAKFSGGGEVNVPVGGSLGGDLKRITYGSEIRMLPRYDSESGRIELTVHADMSDLAQDHGTGVPGRTTSSLDAVVNLELGQALVIAGLSSHSQVRGTSGLPGLSRIPIIGVLFGSHSSNDAESEAVIFVVPSVVDAVTATAERRIDDALRAYLAYDGDSPPPLYPHKPRVQP